MTKIDSFRLQLIISLFFIPIVLFAQNKTGNIVEYFGKEKVEKITEGDVVHVFKNGLSLKVPNFNFNSSSFATAIK